MIYLTKTGIFYENEVSKKCEKYVYREVDSIIPYLTETIEIEDGFIIGSCAKKIRTALVRTMES